MATNGERNQMDLVVVGAGWAGLAAARTYLQIHPKDKVVLLEERSSVGGVWSKERIFPGLRSNNLYGTYEYSDYPVDERFGAKQNGHIPAEMVHKYLTSYAEDHGLMERIKFGSKVDQVVKIDTDGNDGWRVEYTYAGPFLSGEEATTRRVVTRRLIIATGTTSTPNMPINPQPNRYENPIFHSSQLGKFIDKPQMRGWRSVAVLGAGKSAFDAAYAFASRGIKVHWIIRKTGRGPCYIPPSHVTSFNIWLEKIIATRFCQWFSPCIFGSEKGAGCSDGFGWVRRFLHGTWLGRKLVNGFWSAIQNDVFEKSGFGQHSEVDKLKPWNDAFWIGSSLSIRNYPTNIFDLVKEGMIKVHITRLDFISREKLGLEGLVIDVDGTCCCTGWDPKSQSIGLLDGVLKEDDAMTPIERERYVLDRKADLKIMKEFPKLAQQPKMNKEYLHFPGKTFSQSIEDTSPHLYNMMVPPSLIHQRNIGFVGALQSLSPSVTAVVQTLWLTAYFDGHIDIPSDADVEWKTTLWRRFEKWRTPAGYGARHPDLVFETTPQIDHLLGELGLKYQRKSNWFKEIFEPYGPEDYRTVVDEYKEMFTS